MKEVLRSLGGGGVGSGVGIGNLRKTKEMINTEGDVIDPATKQIIKRADTSDASVDKIGAQENA